MFLAKADLFGYDLRPTFKGESKISTNLGGIISLLLITLFTFGLFYTGKEIINKNKPISNVSSIRMEETSISLKEIPIVFAVIAKSGEFLQTNADFAKATRFNTTILEIKTSENGKFEIVYYNIPLVFCNKELLGEEYYETAKKTQAGIEYGLCLDYNNVTAMDGSRHPDRVPSIKNPFGSQNSAHLNVKLELCDEKADPGCRAGIESIGSFHFVTFFPQGILNILDNNNPISVNFDSIQSTAFVGLSFSQTIKFNINELVSDEGWILENINSQTFYTADPPIYNVTQYSENDRIIGTCLFPMKLTKNVVNRRYMKLQELIANLGGFVKVSMVTFSFILRRYSQWTLYKQLVSVEAKPLNTTNSNILVNTMINSSISLADKKIKKTPSFVQFILGMLSKNQAKKNNIKWGNYLKYLDLTFLKKNFEELESFMKQYNMNK